MHKNGAPVKYPPTWNMCAATKVWKVKTLSRILLLQTFVSNLLKLTVIMIIRLTCWFHFQWVLVASILYKNDSITGILQLFCFYGNKIFYHTFQNKSEVSTATLFGNTSTWLYLYVWCNSGSGTSIGCFIKSVLKNTDATNGCFWFN